MNRCIMNEKSCEQLADIPLVVSCVLVRQHRICEKGIAVDERRARNESCIGALP
jgi:hypothetical protein